MMPRHRVLFVLILAAIACCMLGGFVSEAPNRLVSGQPIMLWQADATMSFWLALLAVGLVLLSLLPSMRGPAIAALILGTAALLMFAFDAGHIAAMLAAATPPATRISLGWAFWASGFCLVMIVIDALQRLRAGYLLM